MWSRRVCGVGIQETVGLVIDVLFQLSTHSPAFPSYRQVPEAVMLQDLDSCIPAQVQENLLLQAIWDSNSECLFV